MASQTSDPFMALERFDREREDPVPTHGELTVSHVKRKWGIRNGKSNEKEDRLRLLLLKIIKTLKKPKKNILKYRNVNAGPAHREKNETRVHHHKNNTFTTSSPGN